MPRPSRDLQRVPSAFTTTTRMTQRGNATALQSPGCVWRARTLSSSVPAKQWIEPLLWSSLEVAQPGSGDRGTATGYGQDQVLQRIRLNNELRCICMKLSWAASSATFSRLNWVIACA